MITLPPRKGQGKDQYFHDYGNKPQYPKNSGKAWYNQVEKGWYSLKYKETILQMVKKIHNEKTLKRLYKIVSYFYTHETGS